MTELKYVVLNENVSIRESDYYYINDFEKSSLIEIIRGLAFSKHFTDTWFKTFEDKGYIKRATKCPYKWSNKKFFETLEKDELIVFLYQHYYDEFRRLVNFKKITK